MARALTETHSFIGKEALRQPQGQWAALKPARQAGTQPPKDF